MQAKEYRQSCAQARAADSICIVFPIGKQYFLIFQAIAVVCADALAAPAVAPEFEKTEKTVYSILIRDKWFKDTIW